MPAGTLNVKRQFPSELAAKNRQTVRAQVAQINQSLKHLQEALQIPEAPESAPISGETEIVSLPPVESDDKSLENAMAETEYAMATAASSKTSQSRKRTWLPW